MRLLLDESIPKRLRRFLPNHAIRTVIEMGWGGVRNAELLVRAAKEFDALISVDKNLQYQQNLGALPITIIVLDARSNELPYLLPLIPKLEEALASLLPRTFVRIAA